jgi:YHS domain-containing protein
VTVRALFLSAALAAVLAAAAPGLAVAGEQYVDATGFAVSGHDVVSYFDLPQSVVGQPQPAPLPGSALITADYNGARFAFASEANRARFLADPAAFVPQYDGHCAYGVAQGGKVPGNPLLWRIVDGKLYLNITRNVVGFWEADIPGNLTRSQANWPGIEPAAASGMAIPDFTSAAPVGG